MSPIVADSFYTLLANNHVWQRFDFIFYLPRNVVPKFCNRRLRGYLQAATHLGSMGFRARQ